MNRTIFLLVPFLLACLSGCGNKSGTDDLARAALIGKWELDAEKQETRSLLQFTTGGTVVLTKGTQAATDVAQFRIEGGKLLISADRNGSHVEASYHFEVVSTDELIIGTHTNTSGWQPPLDQELKGRWRKPRESTKEK